MPLLAGETCPEINATSGRLRTALPLALVVALSMRSYSVFETLLLRPIKAMAEVAAGIWQTSMLESLILAAYGQPEHLMCLFVPGAMPA